MADEKKRIAQDCMMIEGGIVCGRCGEVTG